MVGITLAYVGLIELRALDQHRNNSLQLSRPDEQNDIGPTSFVNVGPTKMQKRANVGPTNDCNMGCDIDETGYNSCNQ